MEDPAPLVATELPATDTAGFPHPPHGALPGLPPSPTRSYGVSQRSCALQPASPTEVPTPCLAPGASPLPASAEPPPFASAGQRQRSPGRRRVSRRAGARCAPPSLPLRSSLFFSFLGCRKNLKDASAAASLLIVAQISRWRQAPAERRMPRVERRLGIVVLLPPVS